jgi:hypothetical protein
MKPFVALLATVAFALPASAQPPTGEENREAMKKLAYLVGQWKGPAEMSFGPNRKESVSQTEDVEYRLGGTILVIEGTGRGTLPGTDKEGIVFNAYAVVSYDVATKQYRMKAYRKEGTSVDADVTVADRGFVWGFKDPQRGTRIRYTMTWEKDGTWKEIGEYTTDDKTYQKFFEMNLKKKS